MTVDVTAQPIAPGAAAARSRARRWPAAIVAILVLHSAGMVAVILIATRDPSFSVEPNHYQKALAWDAFSARQRASQTLGWKVEADTETATDDAHTRGIACRILDRVGTPITGATVSLLAFAHARGDERIQVDLVEAKPAEQAGPGVYRARAPLLREGIWELRFVARRGAERFTSTLLHTVRNAR